MFTHAVPLLKLDLHCLETSPYRWAFPLINYQMPKCTNCSEESNDYWKLGEDFPLSKSLENLVKKSDSMDSLDLNNNPVVDRSNLKEYDPYAYGFRPLSERNVLRTFEMIPGKSTTPQQQKSNNYPATTTTVTSTSKANDNKNKNVTTITVTKKIIKHEPSKSREPAAATTPATPKPEPVTTNSYWPSKANEAYDEVDGPLKSALKTSTKSTNTDPVRIKSKCDLNYSERAIDVLKEWIIPPEKQDANGEEKDSFKVIKDKPPQPPRLIIPPRTPTITHQTYELQYNRGFQNKPSIYRTQSLYSFTDEDMLRLNPIPTKIQTVKCTEFKGMEMKKTRKVHWV